MSLVQRIATLILTLTVAGLVGAAAWWLVATVPSPAKPDKPPAPAAVGKVVKDDEFNTVTLTEQGETRIGLKTAEVREREVGRVRVYPGEVAVPQGRTILVTAPLAGTLKVGKGPTAGEKVKKGETVFSVQPILTPEGRINTAAALADAEGQVKTAEKTLQAAELALTRAKSQRDTKFGTAAAVEVAQGAFNVAKEEVERAGGRKKALAVSLSDAEASSATALPITSPEDGLLRTVSALPGQTVAAGAALFEVIDLSTVWVRVPLPVGDVDAVDRTAGVRVGRPSAPADAKPSPANPVAAPPAANPLAATVDAVYELPNPGGLFVPGQRVGVQVPLAGPAKGLTVPWSAVVTDVYGGTWVYERTAPHKFARKRVEVLYTHADGEAVLKAGPPPGTTVATAGVMQLFAAETGFVK